MTRREQVLLRWQVITRYPALITRMFARLEEFHAIVASAVAVRVGMTPDDASSAPGDIGDAATGGVS